MKDREKKMQRKKNNIIVKTRILKLEDKLMDVIEISSKYEFVPVPVFEAEMSEILKEIEYLDSLID